MNETIVYWLTSIIENNNLIALQLSKLRIPSRTMPRKFVCFSKFPKILLNARKRKMNCIVNTKSIM